MVSVSLLNNYCRFGIRQLPHLYDLRLPLNYVWEKSHVILPLMRLKVLAIIYLDKYHTHVQKGLVS